MTPADQPKLFVPCISCMDQYLKLVGENHRDKETIKKLQYELEKTWAEHDPAILRMRKEIDEKDATIKALVEALEMTKPVLEHLPDGVYGESQRLRDIRLFVWDAVAKAKEGV